MCKMCRFAGVPTPKSVSEFIRDSPGHWDTGTGRHKKKMCRFAGVPTPKSVSEFIRDSPGHWDTDNVQRWKRRHMEARHSCDKSWKLHFGEK